MYFLIPVALFALCLAHGIVRAVQDVRREREEEFWDTWHLKAAKIVEQIEREVLAESLAFRYHWNDRPATAAADNRQGVPMNTTVPEHLRGSIGMILDRPVPEKQIMNAWFTFQDFRVVDPGSAAFLINDVVS